MRRVACKSKDKWDIAVNDKHMPESLPTYCLPQLQFGNLEKRRGCQ